MNTLRKTRAVVILMATAFLISCSEEQDARKLIDITLAAEMSLLPTTVWVAENKGYFKKHNINLTIREFDSGRNALETMLKDETINISTVAQTPVVFNSFKDEPYVIVATMAYSLDDIKILARKDRGIVKAEDLKGKKVGATERTTGHYFLEGFISHYGLSLGDIEMKDIDASSLEPALEVGTVDAITSWEPHISKAEKSLGKENLSLLISPTPFRKDFFFTSNRKYVAEHKEEIERFLSALIDAEKFIRDHPEKAQKITSKRLNADLELVKRIWPSFTFEITLDQSILVNLEDEAEWALKLTGSKSKIPNYLNFIDIKPLKSVKPFGVNLIH